MESKELKITAPEGYEIDEEKSTFKCIKFKPKPIKRELPKTWEEFCENYDAQKSEYWILSNSKLQQVEGPRVIGTNSDKNLLPSKELAESMLALCQLIQLRDCYNDGWTPNWTNNDTKYAIGYFRDHIDLVLSNYTSYVLTFKSKELRDEFFKNFKDLIEIVKTLL